MTKEKAQLRRPPKISREAEDFIAGAEGRAETTPAPEVASVAKQRPKAVPKQIRKTQQKLAYPWEDVRVREDVTKVYNLRLSEPVHLQLKWLAKRSPESMHEIALKAVEAEVQRRLRKETTLEQSEE